MCSVVQKVQSDEVIRLLEDRYSELYAWHEIAKLGTEKKAVEEEMLRVKQAIRDKRSDR